MLPQTAWKYKDAAQDGNTKMWKFVVLSFWLGILALTDLRWKRVPIWLLVVGGIFATYMSVYLYTMERKNVTEFLWGLTPGVLLLLMSATTKKAGIADGVVLLCLSLSISYQECIVSFVFSLIAISLASLLLLALHKVRGNSKLPYLPFLLVGYILQTIIGSGSSFQ